MGVIIRAMGRYKGSVVLCVFIKLLATFSELLLPYVLEHIIDDVAPRGSLEIGRASCRERVFWWV